ncbi:MAG TPA: ABC transporter permease [Mesorhizobium sp.]|jgi:phospholipid/cholesterol/gamma-HCH transport system permease protein|nr:ABC transporter permease [Mesorhizobium sp.]
MSTIAADDASFPSEHLSPAADATPRILVQDEDGFARAALSGVWTTRTVGVVDAEMRALGESADRPLLLDLSGVAKMDTAGAWVVERLAATLEGQGVQVRTDGGSQAVMTLLDAVGHTAHNREAIEKRERGSVVTNFLEAVGRGVFSIREDLVSSLNVLGATVRGAQTKAGRGHAVNITSIFHHMDRMGVGAIPVVTLMSAIVGAIVAQQGAFQLRWFGAEIFVVDLVGILVLRELGVLMTAIMIAGRSGSAITAEIGSMKMREEVDALTVIGLNPVGVLVFPRLVALVLAVPLLTVFANFAALGGAILVTYLYSGISPETFIDRLRSAIDLTSIFAGLIKAPFMALIIGIVAAVEGMKVGGSAESLGARVTASVVKAIFVVVIVDGLFAIFYAAIDF